MAKSLKHIVQSIIETLSGFEVTDDQLQKFDQDLVADKVRDMRSLLANQKFKEFGYIPRGFYSLVRCIEILCDKFECGGYEFPDKTYYAILPELVMDQPGIIRYLGLANFENSFNELQFQDFTSTQGRIYTAFDPYYTIVRDTQMGYICIFKNLPEPGTKYLWLNAPINDPSLVCEWDENETYPIPFELTQQLETLVVMHFRKGMEQPTDMISDTNVLLGQPKQQQKEEPQDE